MSLKKEPAESAAEKAKRGRKAGAIPFPRSSLTDALKVPQVIWDNYAGAPTAILDIAKSMKLSPMGGGFIELIRSSQRYGLTNESFTQDVTKTISLTHLGNSIVAPTPEEDVNALKRSALETPDLFRDVLAVIQGKVIPPTEPFKNMLIRTFHLDKGDADACYDILTQNIDELSLSENISGKNYLRLEKLGTAVKPAPEVAGTEEEESPDMPKMGELPVTQAKAAPSTCSPPKANQIFVIHGRNTVPLDQLKKILDDPFKIPYKVAVDEPNVGRPISQKVADLMQNCTSAIVIFTADEEFADAKGNKILRPSDNAVYELGAASILYGKKIVILKEAGVTLSSDFSDLGHITFEKDRLDAKAGDLMKEFIGFGLLKVIPA